jgi:redox-sensitive bicupin YhaK (pirin superfamily)
MLHTVDNATRKIVLRTRGHDHGAITRLVSPGDLGEALKPFVFLDLFDTTKVAFGGFGLHPHSGIATVTYLFEGNVRYEDTTGATGVVPQGGVEFFRTGHGAWHGGGPGTSAHNRGFQLWLALPPDQELGPVESLTVAPESLPRVGPARVLLGSHAGAISPPVPPSPLTYLAVHLAAGESWRYAPPPDQPIACLAVAKGGLATADGATPDADVAAGELVAFERSTAPIDLRATADTELVLGSSVPHDHDLVLGRYSVHTNRTALQAAERRILDIRDELRRAGRLLGHPT